MFNKKMQYVIKSVPTDDRQALEDLLNEMSEEGWDLYTMHEIETDSSIDFDCIFMREKQEESSQTNLDDIVNVTSFKYRMEKMLSMPSSPYASCKEIQLKIANQKEKIKKIKSQLENDNLSSVEKNELNNQMSDELRLMEDLKQNLVNEIAPDNMYSRIREEKFIVNLSEEILELISMDATENLLTETVKVRQNLTDSLGYVIPVIRFRNSDELSQFEFNIKIHDLEVFRGLAFPTYIAFFKEDIKGHRTSKEDIIVEDELTHRELVWIPEAKVKDYWQKGMNACEYIGRCIEQIAVREVSNIMDYNDINKYVEKVMEANSFLVDNLIPDFLTVSDLKYLIACLVREGVSVKNIVYIFEKINDYASEPTKDDLLDKVRLALSKYIMQSLGDDLKVIELSDAITKKVYAIFDDIEDEKTNVLSLDAGQIELYSSEILKIAKRKSLEKIVLVVPMEIRHLVYVMISEFIPDITVIAYEEISNNTADVKFVGTVKDVSEN